MIKKTVLFLVALVFSVSSILYGAEKVEEEFNKIFPQIKPDSAKETSIKGVYEIVYGGRQIIYFHPESGTVIMGALISKEKKNLTEERMQELTKTWTEKLKAKAKDLPLDKAVKVGDGKHKIIEFTDPDCPFCRKAHQYFKERKDITRYIYLFPLKQLHPKAEEKALYVLCSKDKAKAFEEVLAGTKDNAAFDVCKDKAVEDTLKEHIKIGNEMGVTGTPLLIVDDEVVQGANIPQIEKIIGARQEDSNSKAEKGEGKGKDNKKGQK